MDLFCEVVKARPALLLNPALRRFAVELQNLMCQYSSTIHKNTLGLFSPRMCKAENDTTSDWLNRMV